MPIQRKNLFLTWGIRITLVPVILVLLALGLIAIVLFAICGVCGRFLAALGGLAALLALFDKCYQEAAVSAIVAFLLSPYGAPQVLFWLGRKLLEFAGKPVDDSTDYTFDGAVLYTDLPDAPTGSYMGSQGLPVATGETKIGISAWPNDQLEESTDSYLSADTLNSDDLTLTAPLLEGTDYAVAPILAQVEYPADGSSLDVVLPNEVTVLDFYGTPADETTRSSLVHSEYSETSAAVMGLYVQADADFSAQLVYTAPDGSTLTKALHVVIDRSRTMAASFAETTDVAAYAERPTPAVTSGKITKVEKVNGTLHLYSSVMTKSQSPTVLNPTGAATAATRPLQYRPTLTMPMRCATPNGRCRSTSKRLTARPAARLQVMPGMKSTSGMS